MPSTQPRRELDPVAHAHDVVGMYGDPTVSWSIIVDITRKTPSSVDALRARLTDVVASHPTCGEAPDVRVVAEPDWADQLRRVADDAYVAGTPLVRAVCTPDTTRVAIAAHHGVVDGLGLLALLAAAVDTDLRSGARGIATAPAARPFLRRCVDRGVEALVRSPRRFRAERRSTDAGDWLVSAETSAPVSTARLVAAAGAACAQWGAQPRGSRHRFVLAIGASRRPAHAVLTPDRQTAFLRLVDPPHDLDGARAHLHDTAPEPIFPASRAGGLAPLAARLLQRRLGSTALISNLGELKGASDIRSMAFYPSATGPNGVAVGATTVPGCSAVTLRARRSAFTEDGAGRLLALLVEGLERPSQ